MFNKYEPCITPFLSENIGDHCSYCNKEMTDYVIISGSKLNWHYVCLVCSIALMEKLKRRIEKISDICTSCEGYGSFCVDNMYEVDPASDKPEMRECSACQGVGRIIKR